MNQNIKLLLACDLDGTVLPNGSAPLSPDALEIFSQLASKEAVLLAYISGRSLQHALKGMKEFDAPLPDIYVGDVGTSIYHFNNDEFEMDLDWRKEISTEWNDIAKKEIMTALIEIPNLIEQESEYQNDYKISFYFPIDKESLISSTVKEKLTDFGIKATVVTLVDEKTGYLDIIPENATKEHALGYLQTRLGLTKDAIIYSGDGGNDLAPLTSGYNSIVVNNASQAFKAKVAREAKKRGTFEKIYFAKGNYNGMNGNYVAGILEGLNFFRKII